MSKEVMGESSSLNFCPLSVNFVEEKKKKKKKRRMRRGENGFWV